MLTRENILNTYERNREDVLKAISIIRESRKYGFEMRRIPTTACSNEQEQRHWSAIFCLSITCKESVLEKVDLTGGSFQEAMSSILNENNALSSDAANMLRLIRD